MYVDVEGTNVFMLLVILGICSAVLVILLYIVNMAPGQNGQLAVNQSVELKEHKAEAEPLGKIGFLGEL